MNSLFLLLLLLYNGSGPIRKRKTKTAPIKKKKKKKENVKAFPWRIPWPKRKGKKAKELCTPRSFPKRQALNSSNSQAILDSRQQEIKEFWNRMPGCKS